MGYWGGKNWKKINEGKASKKTQNAFIDAYRKLREMRDAENSQGGQSGPMDKLTEDEVSGRGPVEVIQCKDPKGSGKAM